MRLTVDEEVFDVQERPDEPGAYDLAWESAPVPGHAFSIAHNDRSKIGEEEMTDAIRDFLASVDRETGRIE